MLKILLIMLIPKVESSGAFFKELDSAPEKWERQSVACNNWADEYPYAPGVEFAVAHTGKEICIRFYVDEETSMARTVGDNGPVWTDSCAEFFINFDDTGYYNFEFNCIGTALLGWRRPDMEPVHASDALMKKISRSSTLGKEPFEEAPKGKWELSVVIPVEVFFGHDIKSLDGISANANFYKCGDDMSRPHYLSWKPIDNPTPAFHMPQFFGKIKFAEE